MDENGKRIRKSTGTDDGILATALYKMAIAEVKMKKSSLIASKTQNSAPDTLQMMEDDLATSETASDFGSELAGRVQKLESATSALDDKFDSLFALAADLKARSRARDEFFRTILSAVLSRLTEVE